MRSAPPTLPGTPIRPSMPPRSCLAQNVTVPPRSAAASTNAVIAFDAHSRAAMSADAEPPRAVRRPRSARSCRRQENGAEYFRPSAGASRPESFRSGASSSSSVVPPMPSEVCSASETPGRNSTPSSFNRAAALSLIRMSKPKSFASSSMRELIERAAHAARANRQDRVAGPRFAQHEFQARLHRAR